jgi:hypothetical protein
MNILQKFRAAGFDNNQLLYPYRKSSRGKLTGLSKGIGLSQTQRDIEIGMAYKLSQDWDQAIVDYKALAENEFGLDSVVSIDAARVLAGPGIYDTREQRLVNLRPTNGPANQLTIDYFWNHLLRRPIEPGKESVLFHVGVGGSGKTLAIRRAISNGLSFHAILDRVSSKKEEITYNIDKILAAGACVDLRLILRKPEDVFLTRIEEGNRTGHTEPLDQVALRYAACLRGFEAVAEDYNRKPDPRVRISILANFGRSPGSMESVDASELRSLKTQSLGLKPTLSAVDENMALLRLAYEVFRDYDKTHPSGNPGYLSEPFRTAIEGDPARGLQQARKPEEQIHYAGMVHSSVAELDRQLSSFEAKTPKFRVRASTDSKLG